MNGFIKLGLLALGVAAVRRGRRKPAPTAEPPPAQPAPPPGPPPAAVIAAALDGAPPALPPADPRYGPVRRGATYHAPFGVN